MNPKLSFTRQLLEVVIACVVALPISMIANYQMPSPQAILIVSLNGIITSVILLFVHTVMTYRHVIVSSRRKVIVQGRIIERGESAWDTRFFSIWALTLVYWGPFVSMLFNMRYLDRYVDSSSTLMLIEAGVLVFGFTVNSSVLTLIEQKVGKVQFSAFELGSAAFIGIICSGLLLLSLGTAYVDYAMIGFDAVFVGILYWHLKGHKSLV